MYAPYARKNKQSIKTAPEEAQMLGLVHKDLISTVLNMFKGLKETISKELKEVMGTMSHHIKNIHKELEIIRRSQIEIRELKSIITEVKKSLEELTCRFGLTKEKIDEFKD